MNKPLMAKATAVWLVDNTTLSFKQIADFCGMHELEVQGIADGDVAAGGRALAQHRGVHVLAGAGEVARALPLAHVLEHRAVRDVPGVHRGRPDRVEEVAALASGQCPERDRDVRRAERGGAQVPGGAPEQLGGDPGGDHAGGPALVCLLYTSPSPRDS